MLKPLPSQPSAPLAPSRPALPDLEPIRLGAVTRRDASAQAAKSRLQAWRARYYWNEALLLPYSIGREDLWLQMCDLDAPIRTTYGLAQLEASRSIKLLYLCATPGAHLAATPLPVLLEHADAWGDEHVPRSRTAAAIEVAKKIQHDAMIGYAKQRPADRRGDLANCAIPVEPAQYEVLLAAAMPSLTPWQIEWEVPLSRGWPCIHGRAIYEGAAMVWPDGALSKTGRWIAEFRRRHGL